MRCSELLDDPSARNRSRNRNKNTGPAAGSKEDSTVGRTISQLAPFATTVLTPLTARMPLQYCSNVILQHCCIAAPHLLSQASQQKHGSTASLNLLKPAAQHRPSMGSSVAPLPCTSNRRVGYSGRFLRRRVTRSATSFMLRVVSSA